MLSRRGFIAGCCAAHFPLSLRSQTTDAENFICSTIEPRDQMSIVQYSDDKERLEIEESVKSFDISPYGTINVADRWLRTQGLTPSTGKITLGVYFMNGDASRQNKVVQNARVWESKLGGGISFDFAVAKQKSHLRVSFNSNDGNWSYIGKHNAKINNNRETMNIADVYDNIIQHEFGHAIGLQHEHQNPFIGFKWNEDVVIAAMSKQGWSEEVTRANIFTRYGSSLACLGKPKADYESVMFYPVPAGWAVVQKTPGGPWVPFTHPGGKLISAEDINCIKGVYGFKA